MNTSILHLFKSIVQEHPDKAAQYSKNSRGAFVPVTFSELYREMSVFASGLYDLGVRRGDHLGLIADNRKEWLVADLATISLGAIDVPRGRDSMPQEISFILEYAECRLVFVENREMAEKVLSVVHDLPSMKFMVVLDQDFNPSELDKIPRGIKLYTYGDIIEKGNKRIKKDPDLVEQEISKGDIDDVVTIIFTSGTTGEPKGVMLTNRSYLHQVKGVQKIVDIQPGDIWLSVLPVWHSFERVIQYIALGTASALAYSKPIGKIMLQDFQAVRPQWMGSVPRIWEAVKAGIYRNVADKPVVSRVLFHFFVWVGGVYATLRSMFLGRMPRFKYRNRLLDKIISLVPLLVLFPFKQLGNVLVFSAIKKKLGGRFRAGVSGGGSLPAAVDSFFQAAGVCLLNGYGLTETGPVVAVRNYFRSVPLTLDVFPETEIRIVDDEGKDVPPNTRGVVLARGPQNMKGYYKREDITRQIIDDQGWLNTGDLGVWTRDGEFDIRGRAKDTIVLFGGENIEPGPIEAKLRESVYIEQAMVVGQDRKFLGVLIVPDAREVEHYIKANHVPYITREDMLELPDVWELFNSEIQELISSKNGFKHFERIYRFALIPRSFEIGRELSAKQEVKRHVIAELYKEKIDQLFR
ncbi:long-chain fatty acid--CoA ligase [Marispirochaeta sp.]|uniref:AMP-dependent synthetase/ligase n=1 Tax=Marispirochaeta sp. TaxID=2038653 RepID=UPI0029C982CB|nr:long-chain fatty acid--CoA ligase [Marispirochaeta sp.]